MIPFENDNLKAYKLLLRIEVILRECLRESFEGEFGNTWQKKLPGDLLKKIKESQIKENRPNFDFIRLGPLYYLNFGELITILQQKPGRYVANKFGGEVFLKQLENVLVPRNAISHSRPVSCVGLKTIEALYVQMEVALSFQEFETLCTSLDIGLSQKETSEKLIPFLIEVLRDLPRLPTSFQIPEEYKMAILQFWWTEDFLAGFKCVSIEKAFSCISKYNEFSMGVGSSGIRQNYSEQVGLEQVIYDAIIELEKIK